MATFCGTAMSFVAAVKTVVICAPRIWQQLDSPLGRFGVAPSSKLTSIGHLNLKSGRDVGAYVVWKVSTVRRGRSRAILHHVSTYMSYDALDDDDDDDDKDDDGDVEHK